MNVYIIKEKKESFKLKTDLSKNVLSVIMGEYMKKGKKEGIEDYLSKKGIKFVIDEVVVDFNIDIEEAVVSEVKVHNRDKINFMKTGIELITKERQQQIEKHGWSSSHDKEHEEGQLLLAAIYAINPCWENKLSTNGYSGWEEFEEKITLKPNSIEKLRVAGALIAAEIDRINRS